MAAITMSIWLPDFDREELLMLLSMEGVEYTKVNENILQAVVEPQYFEYIQKEMRTVVVKTSTQPSLNISIAEPQIEVPIPNFDEVQEPQPEPEQSAAEAAEAAAQAIEKAVKANVDEKDENLQKEKLIGNIYRVMHNRKFQKIDLSDITIPCPKYTLAINSVSLVKGRYNTISFNVSSLDGKYKGQSKDVIANCGQFFKEMSVDTMKIILKQINHIK